MALRERLADPIPKIVRVNPLVSMTRWASARRLSIVGRSLRMPSATRSAGASGWRLRVAS